MRPRPLGEAGRATLYYANAGAIVWRHSARPPGFVAWHAVTKRHLTLSVLALERRGMVTRQTDRGGGLVKVAPRGLVELEKLGMIHDG